MPPCSAPGGLTSSVLGVTSTVSWTPVSNAIKYDLRRRELGSLTWNYIYSMTATSRTLNNLNQGSTYEWEVRTYCNTGGMSSWSSTQTFFIPGQCTTPLNPNEQNLTHNSVDLVWDIVPGAYTYKIKWRKIGSPVNVPFVTNNILSLSSLDPSSNYKWRVRSECDAFSSNVSSFTSWQHFATLSSVRFSSGDTNLIENVNVYPNPNQGEFYISFVSEELSNFEIIVFDAFGKVLYNENNKQFIGQYLRKVDVSENPKGVYIIQIKTDNSFVSKRVVVQ